MRLQKDVNDQRTVSTESQSSSETESSIDTIGNQKMKLLKLMITSSDSLLLGQRQILLVVHMLLSKITLLENNK